MLDGRIQSVMSFVMFERVADIGADHGQLSIALVTQGRATKVIATEKNRGPFDALRSNISAAGLDGAIDVRLGDGLQVLKAGEVDTICIAGMGGALICRILDAAPDVLQSARQLILQPMNAVNETRDHLRAMGWAIDDEDLAEAAGIIYEIISAVKVPTAPKIFKRESSPLRREFFLRRLKKLERVRDEMSRSSCARSSEKFSALAAEIDALDRICRG